MDGSARRACAIYNAVAVATHYVKIRKITQQIIELLGYNIKKLTSREC